MSSVAMGMSGVAGAVFTPIPTPVVATFGWRVACLVAAALTIPVLAAGHPPGPGNGPRDVGLSSLWRKGAGCPRQGGPILTVLARRGGQGPYRRRDGLRHPLRRRLGHAQHF